MVDNVRLWYKTRNFTTGKTITGFFIKPDLTRTQLLLFTEWGEGFHYLDFDFIKEGPYCGKFFENGNPTLAMVFRKGKFPGIIEYK